jgi:hypothetical protein
MDYKHEVACSGELDLMSSFAISQKATELGIPGVTLWTRSRPNMKVTAGDANGIQDLKTKNCDILYILGDSSEENQIVALATTIHEQLAASLMAIA